MKRSICLAALLLFGVLSSWAQIFFSEAKTSVGVARHDCWSPFHNVATLAEVKKTDVSASFQNRYAEKEFSTVQGQASLGTKILNAGISYASYGFSDFREGIVGFGVARQIGKRFALGAQCDYYYQHFSSQYGSKGKVIVQVGLLAMPMEGLYIGFQVFNPGFAVIKSDGLKFEIPAVFSLGASYWFTPNVVAALSVLEDVRSDVEFSVEVEYLLYKNFCVRALCERQGVVMPGFGCGFLLDAFRLDAGFRIHTQLGVVSDVALSFRL